MIPLIIRVQCWSIYRDGDKCRGINYRIIAALKLLIIPGFLFDRRKEVHRVKCFIR
jgi:hypothetical protein